ncbi:MAG: flagellar hook-length control protein FliK [Betaproteobacteria bacterium]|nr:flagellar hook-length control protein FliK [Betaproteobacteria bacterium]
MGTAVSGSTLNLSASSAAANSDSSRNAANGALGFSFSDLLRAQNNIDTRTSAPLMDTRPTPASSRTPSSPFPETAREPSRTPGDSSSPASRPPRPSQEPVREPARAGVQDSPRESRQTAETPPPQQVNTGTSKPTEGNEEEKNSPGESSPRPQLADAAVSPELPATIAAMLIGIAGEIAEDVPGSDVGSETFFRDTPMYGHPRHPDTSGSLCARTTNLMDDATKNDIGMENDADDDRGISPNVPASSVGRSSKDSIALAATGNEPSARINATAPDMIMKAANAAVPMNSREDSGIRTVPAGGTVNAGDVPMLNPPRLPTQVGLVLPQFTIPSGAGQRAWAEEVGNRVMWMLGRAESRAELILTPPLLGKVEVSIHLNGDQGTAQFLASSQSAREALEQAMPRLRELLAQAGINLGETSVNTSAEDRAHENTNRTGMHTPDAHDGGGDVDATVVTPPGWTRLDNGLIDTFA